LSAERRFTKRREVFLKIVRLVVRNKNRIQTMPKLTFKETIMAAKKKAKKKAGKKKAAKKK
jgi:hypothetical protein